MSPSQQRGAAVHLGPEISPRAVRAPDRPDYTPYVPRGLLRRYMMSAVPITQPRIRTLDNAVVAFFVRCYLDANLCADVTCRTSLVSPH